MALKYTGRASELTLANGKMYAAPALYNRNPKKYAGSLADPLPISQEEAVVLIDASKLHSFETAKGEDLEEKITAPEDRTLTPVSTNTVLNREQEKE